MYLLLAWRNIWRNKRRTIITLSSIAFAVFFASLTQSLQHGTFENMISNSVRFYTGYAQIHKTGYWDDKTLDNGFIPDPELNAALLETPGVINLVPRIESYALVSHGDKTKAAMILGIDPEEETLLTGLQEKVVEGAYLGTSESAILIGKGLSEYLEVNVGDSLALIGQGYHGISAVGKYPIKGIIDTPIKTFSDGTIYMPLPLTQEFFGNEGMISTLTLNIKESTDLNKIKNHFKDLSNDESVEIMDWKEMMPELLQQIELDMSSGKIIRVVLYIIIGFGIFGTFLMMAKERTYEFGMLIALGMRRIRLKLLTILELLIINSWGVLCGVLISLPLLTTLYFNPIKLSGEIAEVYEKFGIEPLIKFSISPGIFFEQGVVVLIISVFLGIYPIWFIHRLIVSEAIRE